MMTDQWILGHPIFRQTQVVNYGVVAFSFLVIIVLKPREVPFFVEIVFDVFWSNVCCDMYVDIYIYTHRYTHTHTHTRIYIYLYVCTYVLVMVCAWVMHAWELKAPTRWLLIQLKCGVWSPWRFQSRWLKYILILRIFWNCTELPNFCRQPRGHAVVPMVPLQRRWFWWQATLIWTAPLRSMSTLWIWVYWKCTWKARAGEREWNFMKLHRSGQCKTNKTRVKRCKKLCWITAVPPKAFPTLLIQHWYIFLRTLRFKD